MPRITSPTTASSDDSKSKQNKRREYRQKLALYESLTSLDAPFGAAAWNEYRELSTWASASHASHIKSVCASYENGLYGVDWNSIPRSLDPCCLLDNVHNTTRKKGVPVNQQIAMLQYSDNAVPPSESFKSPSDSSACTASRGMQKRWQVDSFATVLQVLLSRCQSLHTSDHHTGQETESTQSNEAASQQHQKSQQLHVVDFGCGTGGLLLPLAYLFPECTFTGVEMKKPALDILAQRAAAAGLSNVRCHLGMIEQYKEPFHVGLALHACGNATDYVMLLAAAHRAAFIVSPCCVGKLKFSMEGGSSFSPHIRIYHSVMQDSTDNSHPQQPSSLTGSQVIEGQTSHVDQQQSAPPSEAQPGQQAAPQGSQHEPECIVVSHPRSKAFEAVLQDSHRQFKLMASIADTNFIHAQPASGGKQVKHKKQKTSTSKPPQDAPENMIAAKQVAAQPIASITQHEHEPEDGKDGESQQGDDEIGTEGLEDPGLEAICRCCKLHVEVDRMQAAREAGYVCGLYRIYHAGETAKGDMIVGIPFGLPMFHAAVRLMQDS